MDGALPHPRGQHRRASGDAIDWAKGYGVADAVTRRPVTADTIFQAASISKPIVAASALALIGLVSDEPPAPYS